MLLSKGECTLRVLILAALFLLITSNQTVTASSVNINSIDNPNFVELSMYSDNYDDYYTDYGDYEDRYDDDCDDDDDDHSDGDNREDHYRYRR